MPRQYEAIRDSLTAKGIPLKEAKTSAARIYNSKPANKKHPVGRYSDKPQRRDYGKSKS